MKKTAPTTKTTLITGAAGGIGHALVEVFHAAGFRVIASDKCPRPADLACHHYLQADLLDLVENEVHATDTIAELRLVLKEDGLNALINNAAVQILGGAESLGREDWRTTLNVNLLAPFLLTQALLPALESVRGSVINIGSIHARLTKRNFVAYATSKAALAGMTRALAVDLGPRIRVNAIEPAAVETEMLKAGFLGRPDSYHQLVGCHPQQRIGRPHEVAHLALAMVVGGMDFVHGACVALDGGIGNCLHDPV